MRKNSVIYVVLAAVLLLPQLARAQSQSSIRAVTDKISYDAGSQVMMRLAAADGAEISPQTVFTATIRYAGESSAIYTSGSANSWSVPADSAAGGYASLWTIPFDARTGRYEIDLVGRQPGTSRVLNIPHAGSFAVYRKLVKIEQLALDKTFYVSGDTVGCRIKLKNLSDRAFRNLRVEFSDRYWPWIAGPVQRAAASIVTLATDLGIDPGAEQEVGSSHAATAAVVTEPTIHQYGVVVWDHERKNVLDIAFSPLVMIRPPGMDLPKPYPLQYIYPALNRVNTTSYRRFYPPDADSGAIRFDTSRTMYVPGEDAAVRFSIQNPGTKRWSQVSITARLLDQDGREITKKVLAEQQDVASGAAPVNESVTFVLPATAGLYRVAVALCDSAGNDVAQGALELGVNAMPKSILIFCAHEDDEGPWMGLIRSAVENHIPIHVVYFTSGDAGSCDKYYERSCGPAEAMNFGELRMAEARATLGHLGLLPEDISFFGLPDGGSGEIWSRHHDPANPYLSVLLASDHAPYEGIFRQNLPYARDSVVGAIEDLVSKFHPEVIVTAHPPAEGHIDHVVNNYFVVRALQEMVRTGALRPDSIKLYVDHVYNARELPPNPYHYAKGTLYVSGEVEALAQEAGWFYQSQAADRSEGNIRDFGQLPRTLVYRQMLDWNEHQGWNEKH